MEASSDWDCSCAAVWSWRCLPHSLYGARSGLSFDSTLGFQSAVESACRQRNPATVLIPARALIVVLPLKFSGCANQNLSIAIAGAIYGPQSVSQWGTAPTLMTFTKFTGLTLTGAGYMDGNGSMFWKQSQLQRCSQQPPNLVVLIQCSFCRVQGVRFMNSPAQHLMIKKSSHVTVVGVSVFAPSWSHNTDGVNIGQSSNVAVLSSYFQNGDDCISVGGGSHDILVQGVTCVYPSHGLSIGSLGREGANGCVTRFTAHNIVLRSTTSGLRIKTWQGGTGQASRIVFSNITMVNVTNPILVSQFYCDHSCYTCPPTQHTAVGISDVILTNVQGTVNKEKGVQLLCSQSVPCVGISLNKVYLTTAHGKPAPHTCENAYGVAASTNQLACLRTGKATQPAQTCTYPTL